LPEALTRPIPAYVSLHSALHHHGFIEQIPEVIYAVTLGPTRRVRTPLAQVSLHRVSPEFFFGFERDPRTGAALAVPEKALLDLFYLRPARSRMFRTLPEVEFPPTFSATRARTMLRKIPGEGRRAMVQGLLEDLLARHG
jgi:hypothetical protein